MNWPVLTPTLKELLVQGSASLAGALAGALSAFQLEAWRQRRQERGIRIERLNRALFTLAQQRNYLLNLKRQHLDPNRDNPIRAFLPPVLELSSPLMIDRNELTFLVAEKEAELLDHLGLADVGFKMVLRLAELRAAMHFRFQERVEDLEAQRVAAGIPPSPGPVEAAELRQAIGPRLFRQLTDATDHLCKATEDALDSNRTVHTMAAGTFQRLFPKVKLFKVEEVDPPR